MNAPTWNHDALAEDLAAYLRGYATPMMVWTNLQLGPSGSQRPDVYAIAHTYTALRVMAYEVKVSRSDFLADVTVGKALGYLRFAGAVAFAAPKGLIRKDELPGGAGLVERGDVGWRWAKKPTINPIETLPWQTWVKLLADGLGRERGVASLPQPRRANKWDQERRARKLLGDDLGGLYARREQARYQLEQDIENATRGLEQRRQDRLGEARQELEGVQAELRGIAEAFGLPLDLQYWALASRLRAMRPDADVRRLNDAADALVRFADRALDLAGELRPPAPSETAS